MSDIAELEVEAPGAGPHDVEVRSATALEVRFAERMIDIVAVPYGETTQVMYHGRMIDETVERGAFEGVQMRSRDFKVNRAHDPERPIGWVRKFKPRDDRGLIAGFGDAESRRCLGVAARRAVQFRPAVEVVARRCRADGPVGDVSPT
jgi:hypothetical protein